MKLHTFLAGALLLAAANAGAAVTELNRIVAIVYDDVVTAQELTERTDMVMRQIQKSGTEAPPRPVIERQLLERMILERIQLKLAGEAGLKVEDEAVNQVVANIAAENKISLDQFRQTLAKDGVDFAEYRENIRKEILVARLRNKQVTSRITVTPQEVDNYLKSSAARGEQNVEYRLSHILVALPEAPSPDQLAAARGKAERLLSELKLGADFRQLAIANSDGQQALEGGDLGWRKAGQLPTIFTEAVTRLKEGEVSDLIRSPSGFHILQLTDTRGEAKHVIRQTHARHILIMPSAVTKDAEARAHIERLRERILAGEDFAALARSNSDDKGSAGNGGDLGWANPGQFVSEFEQAMNATPVGGISEPVRTQFGWHIVQPLERRDYDDTDEYRRAQAAESLRQRKVEEETESWLRQIRDEAFVEYRNQ